jgi:cytochrome d ubiquinol oxidase subunit I
VPVFFAFRIMVGLGVAMIAVSWFSAWITRRGTAAPRWLLWTLAVFTFSGWAATLAGWIVTEIGRQPWLVQGVMRTSEAVGKITGAQLGASLTGYSLTYAAMFVAYMVVLTHMAGEGAQAASARTLPGTSPAGAAAN